MALINVKPLVGEVAFGIFPAFLDKYHNAIVMIYTGLIDKIDNNGHVLIKDAPFAIPEWRIQWFTFGGIVINNTKFNIIKIRNEDSKLITEERNRLKKKKVYK